jgi:hypothetical protein
MSFFWDENKPNEAKRNDRSGVYGEVLEELKKREVWTVGLMESMFWATNNIFMFIWTPLLQEVGGQGINIGMIGVSFVLCMILGTVMFDVMLLKCHFGYYTSLLFGFVASLTYLLVVYFVQNFIIRLVLLAFVNVIG